MFIVLLTSLVNASRHTSNQKCEIQPTLINLPPIGYSQEITLLSIRSELRSICWKL